MRKILVLGGTRFVGMKLVNLLRNNESINVFVASRREIQGSNFIKIDRKDSHDLERLFKDYQFDHIIDFINFSASDSKKLIDAISKSSKMPHLVSISTTYVYGHPEKLENDNIYTEYDFNAEDYVFNMQDRPAVDYIQGKRSMESYLARNYPIQKSTIVRFPIILGQDDYTNRTYFFRDIILKKKTICLSSEGKSSNYIFSDEAAEALFYLISNSVYGTFNIVMDPSLNEEEIFDCYCKYYGVGPNIFIDKQTQVTKSPFFYKKKFDISGLKFNNLKGFDNKFSESLVRELKKIENT